MNTLPSPASPPVALAEPAAPKLAVVIACFNYAEYVERAIASVVSQGRDDCELVVVDDGSDDGSFERIARTGVSAVRIENSGQRAACLHGLRRTTAPFVLFLDADDELLPGSLEAIIGALDEGVAKLQFRLRSVDARGQPIGTQTGGAGDFRERERLQARVLRSGVYPSPPTSGNVFRRDVLELLEEVDYDRAVDGVILFAAPFFGDVVGLGAELGLYRLHARNDSGLGRGPDPAVIGRDILRFERRMDHLRRFLRGRGLDGALARGQDTFFHRERCLMLRVAQGRRGQLRHLPGLLSELWREPHGMSRKAALAAFYALAALLPPRRARDLLALRLSPGGRSLAALRSALAPRRARATHPTPSRSE